MTDILPPTENQQKVEKVKAPTSRETSVPFAKLREGYENDASRIEGLLPPDADPSDRVELGYLRRQLQFTSDLVAERLGLFPKASTKDYVEAVKQGPQERLVEFAAEHHFPVDDYTLGDKKLRIIDALPAGERIPQDKVEAYLHEQETVTSKGVLNNCITVAGEAVQKGVVSGRLYSPEGCQDFTSWTNHAVNYDELPDGTVIAIDFTAASNIDWNTKNFDTLALRAKNKAELVDLLGELYGGTWDDQPLGKLDYE